MEPGSGGRITYLGHSTVLIELDGRRILTDPILRSRAGPLRREAPPVESGHWQDLDAVLISHSHWDHLDIGSLRMLPPDVPLLVPDGMRGRLAARGFGQIHELVPGRAVDIGSVHVEATHAEHRGFGPPIGATERSIGFLLEGSHRIYFAGDTARFDGMADLARGLDVALLPVWGWGPRVPSSDHLDPNGAANVLTLLRPRMAIPIHWGTLHPIGLRRMRPSTRVDPPHEFARLAAEVAPEVEVRVLPVGGSLSFEEPEG